MNIAFLSGGARSEALKYILNKGERVVGVVTPFATKKNYKFASVVDMARENDIPVYPVKKDTVKEIIEKLSPDIILSCGFPFLLSKDTVKSVPFAINVHPTLLPKYRGFHAGAHVIINGESEAGVTVHFIDEGVDSGDIILQKKIKLTEFDTIRSMQRKAYAIEGEVIYKALSLLKSGNCPRIHQDENLATFYKEPMTPEDSVLDWEKSLKELYNKIRACDPNDYPAFFNVNGEKVCIKLWRPNKGGNEADMV